MKAKSRRPRSVTRPHILLVMLDDLDVASFDLLLTRNKLPNIQQYLVQPGTHCTQSFVTNSACCPGRASVLTGQYSHNHGVETVVGSNGGFEAFHDCRGGTCQQLARPTLATWLHAAGYYTGFVGKYMNGYPAHASQVPAGWDHWTALHTPGNGYDLRPNQTAGLGQTYRVYRRQPGGTVVADNPQVYQTKYLGDQSVAFFQEWAGSGRDSFFLFLSPVAPHVGSDGPGTLYQGGQAHPQYLMRVHADRPGWKGYCDEAGGQWCAGSLREGGDPNGNRPKAGYDLPGLAKPSFNRPDCPANKPAWICENWPDLNQNDNLANLRRLHLDRLESMLSVDVMIGQLIGELGRRGVLADTLIIFTSDNGFYLGEFRLGNKQHPHEESIAVPLIVRRPGQSQATPNVNQLVTNQDIAPTLLDYAGLLWHDPVYGIDGRSLRPLLEQPNGVAWRKQFLVEHRYPRNFNPPSGEGWLWAIPDYTAVRTEGVGGQLYAEHYRPFDEQRGNVRYVEHYDMAADPYQTNNLRQNPAYDRARLSLSSLLGRLRIAQGQQCRELEDEAAAAATERCRLVDTVTIKNMYNPAGQLTHLRQHVYAGGNAWYRDTTAGLNHVWGEWRMLSLVETWGAAANHPPVADLEAAVIRDWYDAADKPTAARQIFYQKGTAADAWYRTFANPQTDWFNTDWFALRLDDIPWLAGNNRIDAAVFRPMFNADGTIRNIRQIFYVNGARSYYYRDSRNADGSYDPTGMAWPAEWQSGSYQEWASDKNPPPTDRLDAVEMALISADRRMRQLFYAGAMVWWRNSAANGVGFPRQWQSARLEDHFKTGWPLQMTYPRPPFSCP